MSKKKGIASNEELARYRSKLRHRATGWGFGWFFIILVLYFLYVFFAVAPVGYGGEPAFSWAANWSFTLPYFDTTNSLLVVSDTQVVLRWVVLAVVLIVAIWALFIVRAILISAYKGKAMSAHDKALANYIDEEYGIKTLLIPDKGFAQEEDVLSLASVEEIKKEYTITLYNHALSLDACQYSYSVDGTECQGVVAVTELVSPKVAGLIQFRTFGAPESRVIGGASVEQYPVEDERLKDDFTVFTTLSKEELDAFCTEGFLSRLVKLRRLTTGGIIFTVSGTTVSVVIDGMALRIGRSLRENLPDGFLEKQGLAVKTLFDIYDGFVRDCSLTGEDSETPLVQPLGQTPDNSTAVTGGNSHVRVVVEIDQGKATVTESEVGESTPTVDATTDA